MRFTVADICIGIDSEFMPHLFDQFEQYGKSPKIYLKKLPELRVLVADDDRDCCEHALWSCIISEYAAPGCLAVMRL